MLLEQCVPQAVRCLPPCGSAAIDLRALAASLVGESMGRAEERLAETLRIEDLLRRLPPSLLQQCIGLGSDDMGSDDAVKSKAISNLNFIFLSARLKSKHIFV